MEELGVFEQSLPALRSMLDERVWEGGAIAQNLRGAGGRCDSARVL